MTPDERAKVIRRNRRDYGMDPGTGYRKDAEPPASKAIVSKHVVRGQFAEFAKVFKPPPGVKLVAGIPAVAIGVRLPGERRLKRRRK